MVLVLYFFVLFLLGIYSYALVDPNFTLVNHPIWEWFRNTMVDLGYYQRGLSTIIFFGLVGLLGFFNWYFWQKGKAPVKLALVIGMILLFSYPFLSHDFFNYLFDAKILTVYGQNPYFHKALDFPQDPWLRFMHWTHRTYPYGPTFLLLTLVPSFFSFAKLILAFLFFKLLFLGFYLLGVWVLNKFDKQLALFFATSPLVIIEGLVNNHNDLIGVSLALLALYYWQKKHSVIKAGILGLISIGIKYVTVASWPLLFKKRKMIWLSLGSYLVLFAYIFTKLGIQPWYLLNLLVLLPFAQNYFQSFTILGFGALISYYPYLYFGGWDRSWKVELKEQIIGGFLFIFILVLWLNNRRLSQLPKIAKPR